MVSGIRSASSRANQPFFGSKKPCRASTVAPTPTPNASAVDGDTLAFAFEDLARSGYGGAGRQQAWLTVPSSMPTLAALVKDRQYGVLVWRGSAGAAPTDLHLPRSFAPAGTTVVSDLGTVNGVPASGPVAAVREPGSSTANRLRLTAAAGSPGALHVALVVNTTTGAPVTADQLAAARTELSAWTTRQFPTG